MDLFELKKYKSEINSIATRFGAINVRIFGSVARGEQGPESDIDFLVEMEKGRTLLDRIALIQELQQLLHRKVDVITEKAMKERIKANILQDAIML